jgi:hypothetical protein
MASNHFSSDRPSSLLQDSNPGESLMPKDRQGQGAKSKGTKFGPPTPPALDQSNLDGINTEQMFRLIQSILPFEACLYHQVLPLSVEGKYLHLGMVSPQDQDSLEYVQRMIGYINCKVLPQAISSTLHQAMLSAYLNYTERHQISTPQGGVRGTVRSELLSESLALQKEAQKVDDSKALTPVVVAEEPTKSIATTPPITSPIAPRADQAKIYVCSA